MANYKQLCAELLRAMDEIEECEAVDWSLVKTQPLKMANQSMAEARAALAESEPQHRCIYSPVQIAECGGPCEQGPEHCDCGELWVTEPELKEPTSRQLMMLADDMEMTSLGDSVEYARAVLARWGNRQGLLNSSSQLS